MEGESEGGGGGGGELAASRKEDARVWGWVEGSCLAAIAWHDLPHTDDSVHVGRHINHEHNF